jgi:glutaredoxin-like protein NrdH
LVFILIEKLDQDEMAAWPNRIIHNLLRSAELNGDSAGGASGKGKGMSDTDSNVSEEGNTQPDVKIYSLSTCSHCKATKKFLGECTIKYEFIDVDLLEGDERKAIIEDVKKFNPRCSFPTVIIGDKVIVGYKEKEIKEALGLE